MKTVKDFRDELEPIVGAFTPKWLRTWRVTAYAPDGDFFGQDIAWARDEDDLSDGVLGITLKPAVYDGWYPVTFDPMKVGGLSTGNGHFIHRVRAMCTGPMGVMVNDALFQKPDWGDRAGGYMTIWFHDETDAVYINVSVPDFIVPTTPWR